jgi:hypothetical protein
MAEDRMFLTLTHLTEPARHREYNAWHQLDHLPENLLLDGVVWGNRWVRTPECAAVSTVNLGALDDTQYAVMYSFRSPFDASVERWTDLNRRALWWGRRPELAWTSRNPTGFFESVKGYAAPRTLVSPDAIPLRPHRGVHLTISRLAAPETASAVATMQACDRELVSRALTLTGVAGARTYRFSAAAGGFGKGEVGEDAGLLVRILFLDDDPCAVTSRLHSAIPNWRHGSIGEEDILLSSPFESITPWEWDWFDN